MAKRVDLLKEQLSFLQSHNASKEEIEELEKKIARSKRGKSSRSKGSSYERTIAKVLMLKFPRLDLARTPSSGGFKKKANNEEIRGDISNLNKEVQFMLHVECKNQKTVQMEKWMKQAEDDCPSNKVPTVVYHQQQKIVEGKVVVKPKDYICLPLADFINIVKPEYIVKELVVDDGSTNNK